MEAVNKSHWRSLKKFVGYALKKAEKYGIDEDAQIRLRIILGLMRAVDERQDGREYSLFEGEGLTETFSISVNQIFEGYYMPADDYLIAHTRFREERPYVRGLAFDFGKYGLMYEGNKDLFDVMYCTSGAVFAVAESLVSEVLLYHIGAAVERMPRYLQELYQQAFDSARAAYEQSNGKSEHVFRFEEECAMKVPEISRADYDTILLHAEKISNSQHDCIPVLRRELRDKLKINDIEPLVEDLVRNKDIEFLNRVRLFLSQYPFVVENEEGVRYQLVKRGNFCELDFVEQNAEPVSDDTPARATEKVVEEVTLETRAERIRQLQADVQRGIIEIGFELIAAKKEIGHGGWVDWLEKEFEWTDRTARYFMAIAQRFGNRNTCSDLRPSTLKAMLALPEGDEEAFIAAQAQAGNPVEKQSAREVQASVKKWKSEKEQKSTPPFDQINLFSEIVTEEVGSQSDDESESDNDAEYATNLDFDSSDSELTSPPTEESDEREEDSTLDEQNQSQREEENILPETLTVNSGKENFDVDLNMKRAETRRLLDEISEFIQTATDIKLDETIRGLKALHAFLSASCE